MSAITDNINAACDRLSSLVDEALQTAQSREANESSEQLKSVSQAIQSLEAKSVPVPPALGELEKSLQQTTGAVDEANAALAAAYSRVNALAKVLAAGRRAPALRVAGAEASAAGKPHVIEDDIEPYIIDALGEMGGEAPQTEVLNLVESRLAGQLTAADLEPDHTGQPSWHATAQWAYQNLLDRGLVEAGSGKAAWKLVSANLKKSA